MNNKLKPIRKVGADLVSTNKLKIILGDTEVEEYLREHNAAKNVQANQSVIDVDDLDGSVEYVNTELASPKSKKIRLMNDRIFKLENCVESMKQDMAKKNRGEQPNVTNASMTNAQQLHQLNETISSTASVEPQSSSSSALATSVSLNSTSSLDFDVSYSQQQLEEMVGMMDAFKTDGLLPEINDEIMGFLSQQEQQQ